MGNASTARETSANLRNRSPRSAASEEICHPMKKMFSQRFYFPLNVTAEARLLSVRVELETNINVDFCSTTSDHPLASPAL